MMTFNIDELLGKMRPYQLTAIEALKSQIDAGSKRPLLQLPTGAGKTEVALTFAGMFFSANEKKRNEIAMGKFQETGNFAQSLEYAYQQVPKPAPVIWLTDREELNLQTAARFNKYGIRTAALTATNFPARFAGMTPQEAIDYLTGESMDGEIGSAAVISHRVLESRFDYEDFPDNNLAFSDEAHHDFAPTRLRVTKKMPGVIVGLTATPERMNPREGMDAAYDSLIQGLDISATIRDLENDGYLLPVVVQSPAAHLKVVGSKPVAGDFTEFSVIGSETAFNEQAVRFVWEQTNYGKDSAIWYTTTKEHCLRLAEFASQLMPASKIGVVLSGTEHFDLCKQNGWHCERQRIAELLREGKIWLVLNVMVLTEGVDFPGVSTIVTDRPTLSPIVWNQQVGRGRRPDGEAQYCKLISFTDNVSRLGHPSSERKYSLQARILTPATRPAPTKDCLACGAEVHAACRNCPKCGNPFGKFCSNCKDYRFWRAWLIGSDKCDHCVRGAKPPLMFQNGFNDHLKDDILVVGLEGIGTYANPYKIAWRNSDGKKVVYHETLVMNESGYYDWLSDDQEVADELPYYAKIVNQSLVNKQIVDLWNEKALGRVQELGLLTEHQARTA